MNAVAEAVGWALVHSLWQGALAAAALGVTLLATRSPRIRHGAACVAILAMLMAFGFACLTYQTDSAGRREPAPSFPVWDQAAQKADNGNPAALSSLSAIVPSIAPFWLFGATLFLLRNAVAWFATQRLRRRGVCAASSHWQGELDRLASQLRVSRAVLLLESALAESPIVLGHLRPVILIPAGLLMGLPAGHVEAILAHELAHIRRNDYLLNLFQRLAESLFFYHPAVWWISSIARTEREHCCDDVVVALQGGEALEYAKALAALEQFRDLTAVAATGGNLMKRIHRMLHPNTHYSAHWAAPLLLTVIAAALAAVTAAPALFAVPAPSPAPQEKQAEQQSSSPYSNWLNQDVAYIIAEAERAAFERLATDEERQMFIKQFWLRRDPTPGTPANEFMTEHYRRIEYANKHFRTPGGTAGWKTDLGHMYIVYGPPDELEMHPSGGGATTFPNQVWLYRHVEGIGDNVTVTFVDRGNTGEFRLAPGKSK